MAAVKGFLLLAIIGAVYGAAMGLCAAGAFGFNPAPAVVIGAALGALGLAVAVFANALFFKED